MDELSKLGSEELLKKRIEKFRKMGVFLKEDYRTEDKEGQMEGI